MGNYWKMMNATNFHKELENCRFWQPFGGALFCSRSVCDQSLRPTWVPERALGRNVRWIFATFWLTTPIWDIPGTPLEWILMGFFRILCVALVIRGVQVLFQLRPKFATIPVLPSVRRLDLPALGGRGGGRVQIL